MWGGGLGVLSSDLKGFEYCLAVLFNTLLLCTVGIREHPCGLAVGGLKGKREQFLLIFRSVFYPRLK